MRIIHEGTVIELLVYSPEGDPLGTVEIAKLEAYRRVCLPVMMGHVFRAAREKAGRVFVEPVEWSDSAALPVPEIAT